MREPRALGYSRSDSVLPPAGEEQASDGGHREDLMHDLNLTDDEKAGMVAFLLTLTGDDTSGVAVAPPSSPIP